MTDVLLAGNKQVVTRWAAWGLLAGWLTALLGMPAWAQGIESTAPPPGLRENTPAIHALTNARIVTAPGKVIERGTLVVRDGVILELGADVQPRPDARVWDCEGKTIYPGLIDAYGELATEAARANLGTGAGAGYWNPAVTPELRADQRFKSDAATNRKFRSQGITVRSVAPTEGIIKGTSVAVTTGEEEPGRAILNHQVGLHLQLTTTRQRGRYPNSPMGAYTLVRQAFHDAQWYGRAWDAYGKSASTPRPETNDALAALAPFADGQRTVFINAPNVLYFFRAHRLAEEFGLNAVVIGSGEEYQRLDEVRAAQRVVIVPVNFPKPPNVGTPEAALSVSLARLMHWDHAPENPARLDEAGVSFALTAHGLSDVVTFLSAVRKSVARGLDADTALAALTTVPARILGLENKLGTLAVGKAANLVVVDGDLFAEKTKIFETWVDGRRYEVQTTPAVDLRGGWELQLLRPDGGSETLRAQLTGEPNKLSGKLLRGEKEAKFTRTVIEGLQWQASVPGKTLDWTGTLRISAVVTGDDAFDGVVQWADGTTSKFSARRATDQAKPGPDERSDDPPPAALFAVNYPLGEFGLEQPPEQPAAVLFRNATVWTCGPEGTLSGASVLVEKGLVKAVGKNLTAPADAVVIDCRGKHLSPGIIDCHSHIATDGGVNESGQTITAEVRIGDFIDPHDINLYRQLAGGVTAANILHGSANTIGGQNQVIKFRWGASAEQLKFFEAPPGIKFALGENVKQSNWGESYTTRYPQTRMGVEQLLNDAFNAAVFYRLRWQDYRRFKRGLPPRVDLELEALSEVVAGKRLIHCHSYRQDEILAMMRVCEQFNIRIATLQHILEGYKVADVMARHGVGGSSFADWWAYKFEVYDAIPYNGSVLYEAGVLTSFNSDDAELARRLNLEAAKAVKYGGVPPAEALKFVTFNPAKQLGVDHLVGSLEPGKHADLVVWNGSPLSSLSHCEQTWIDGRLYFSRQRNEQLAQQNAERHAALVQRVLDSGETQESLDEARSRDMLWPREDIFCNHSRGQCECHGQQ